MIYLYIKAKRIIVYVKQMTVSLYHLFLYLHFVLQSIRASLWSFRRAKWKGIHSFFSSINNSFLQLTSNYKTFILCLIFYVSLYTKKGNLSNVKPCISRDIFFVKRSPRCILLSFYTSFLLSVVNFFYELEVISSLQ